MPINQSALRRLRLAARQFFSFAAAMSLDFNSLCTVASFLKLKDFKAFLSTCQAWSLCRHDMRTVAQVYVNTNGDYAPFAAVEQGLPIVRFFARQFPDKIVDMTRKSIVCGNEDSLVFLKPFVSDDMAVAVARRVICGNANSLARFMEHWDLDDTTRCDLIASRLNEAGNIVPPCSDRWCNFIQ